LANTLFQEEEILKQQGHYSVHLVSQGTKKKWKKPKIDKKVKPHKVSGPPQVIEVHENGQKNDKCCFCRKFGHIKKDCYKCKAWFKKKAKPSACVCFESTLTKVRSNAWWINSGSSEPILIDFGVWILLRKNKTITRRNVLQVEDFLKLSIQIFVQILTHHILVEKSILLLLLMTFHVSLISTCCVKKSQPVNALEVYFSEVER